MCAAGWRSSARPTSAPKSPVSAPPGSRKAVVALRLADDRGQRVAERAIVRGGSAHERFALFRRQRERAIEQFLPSASGRLAEVQVFFQSYALPPASSWRSQARALNHSRCAVRTDRPSASAVSRRSGPRNTGNRPPPPGGDPFRRACGAPIDLVEDALGIGGGGVARLVERHRGLLPAALLDGRASGHGRPRFDAWRWHRPRRNGRDRAMRPVSDPLRAIARSRARRC